MINFGTSAYMKTLALNPRPRDSSLRKRIAPSESGYDFHKAMRRIAGQYFTGKLDVPALQIELLKIRRPVERAAATEAINQLDRWLAGRKIDLAIGVDQKYTSENGMFSVKFTPDFAIEIAGLPTYVHLWNTKSADLTSREAIGTLGLFERNSSAENLGVLCLRTRHLYLLGEATRASELARILARDVEKRLLKLAGDHHNRRGDDYPDVISNKYTPSSSGLTRE